MTTFIPAEPTREAYVLSLLAEGRFEAAFRAIDEFNNAAQYAPDFSNHAHQMMECGQLDLAEDLFGKALALDGHLAPAHCGLGILYLRQGKVEAAIKQLREATARDERYAVAQAALGIALSRAHKFNEAVEHLARALEIAPAQKSAIEVLGKIKKALPRKQRGLAAKIDDILAKCGEGGAESGRGPTVTVCMIVKDEEDTLARCLESVRGAADEIVIVDTGSTDRTVDIAKQFGAKLGYFAWCNDFAAARNHALGLAESEWVLIMDADDEMERGGAAALRLFLNSAPEADICSLRTRIPCPGGMETFIEHPRLFRNGRGLRYVNAVHEQLVRADGTPAAAEVACGISVYHHGYLDTEEEAGARRERNFQILLAELEKKPEDSLTHFFLGKEYRNDRKFTKAIVHFQKALALSEDKPTLLRRMKSYSYLAEALVVEGRAEEAVAACREALESFGANPELWFGLGEALRAARRTEEAKSAYEKALAGRFGEKLANQDFMCRDVKPRLRLAEMALEAGDIAAAEMHWQKAYEVRGEMPLLKELRERLEAAVARNGATQEIEGRLQELGRHLRKAPDDLQARSDLVGALIMLGRAAEAEKEAKAACSRQPSSGEAWNLQGAALAAGEKWEEAAAALKRAVTQEPKNADILCNLAIVYSNLGRMQEAARYFGEALRADGKCLAAHLGRGQMRLQGGEFEQATGDFEAALEREPECVEAWLGLGRAYLERGILPAAMTAFQKAVAVSGGAPEVMEQLAQVRRQLTEKAGAQPAPSLREPVVGAGV